MSDYAEEAAKRTRVACETCRRKKIKCSGDKPQCLHCQQLNLSDCTYVEKTRKKILTRDKVKKSSNGRTLLLMESRLNKLEGFMANISEKLNEIVEIPGKKRSKLAKSSTSSMSSNDGLMVKSYEDHSSLTTSEEEDDDDEVDKTEDEALDIGKDHEKSSKNDKPRTVHHTTDKYEIFSKLTDLEVKKLKNNPQEYRIYSLREEYFESHSFLLVCSQKSLSWIRKSLHPSKLEVLNQFNRFPYLFFMRARELLKKWTDPIIITPENKVRILERPLPEDKAYVLSLLEVFSKKLFAVDLAVSMDTILELLEKYYNREKLTSSQLLLLVSVVYLVISIKVDGYGTGLNKSTLPPEMLKFDDKYLIDMQNNLFDSMVAFYHRISVVGQGVQTVQAIILLSFALAIHGIPDVDYMLLAVAIRHAKEMGLHRAEEISKYSSHDAQLRKKLWWLCQEMDIEFSYRHGKSPVLTAEDYSEFSPGNMSFLLENLFGMEMPTLSSYTFDSFDFDNLSRMSNHILTSNPHGRLLGSICYSNFLVSRVRVKAYFNLFSSLGSANANIESTLNESNADALKICDAMSDELKPRFYDEPGFCAEIGNLDPDLRDQVFDLQCKFFVHLLLTNRVPFLIQTNIDNANMMKFRKIHLRSARTLIHLALMISKYSQGSLSLNWLCFYPFAGFLMLLSNCMNNPGNDETLQDAELLMKVSDVLFAEDAIREKRVNYLSLVTIGMKLFVQVVFAVIESQTNAKIPTSPNNLRHLRFLKKHAPELFHGSKSRGFEIKMGEEINEKPYMASFKSPASDHALPIGVNANSPRYNPSLANIIHPEDHGQPMRPEFDVTYGSASTNSSSPDILHGAFDLGDEQLSNMVAELINQLPNFFFDNNLGF